MADANSGNTTLMQRLAALVGHSAEYSIAFALLAVCLIVGLAVWLLQPSAPQVSTPNATSQAAPAHAADAKGADEQAALGAWKQRLAGGFDQMDQQQRRAEEERARKEQQREEDEAAARARSKAKQAAAAPAAAAPSPDLDILQQVAAPAPKAVIPKPQAVHVDAAIDWTSCKRPVYPEISMHRNEQGVVTVSIDLDVNANILRSRISKSSGYDRLDLAAQHAIEKCHFHSATTDGVPQASTAIVRFTWALQNTK